MLPEEFHRWMAIAATLFVFLGLQFRRGAPTDLLFMLALIGVTVVGVITPEDAFRGFANPALLTIAGLLVVAAGLRSSGVLDWVGNKLLGSVETERAALLRLVPALIASSAFMLNTALVAMAAPVVVDWCRRKRISPSRLLLPVSYLTILGGVCTMIGTSTTLIANGILKTEQERRVVELDEKLGKKEISDELAAEKREFIARSGPMGLFELGEVGFPCAIVGAMFMIFVAPRLLPNRTDMIEQLGEQRREYLVELQVLPTCPLIGQDVESAGLRHLPGLFLIEIDREGDTLTPVSPQDVIHAGDRLIFTGVVSTIVDLEKIPGLVPAADITYEIHPETRTRRRLTEVVLSRTSPLIGQTVREANFRRIYNAAVVAIHRNGVRLTNKIGSIGLEPGDTLLLQTRDDFVSAYRNSRDFYLVSSVEGDSSRRHDKAKVAGSLVLGLIVWLILGAIPGLLPANLASPAVASLGVAVLMILTGCLRVSEARNALDMRVLVTIAAALGLGLALESSGAARMIATGTITAVGDNPYLLLAVVYLAAIIMTELISNNAVAAMLLPLSIAVAEVGGIDPRPFILAITLAASLSFATPIGYQTNLMVMGPGGYKPIDYLRCGGPLAILIAVTALTLLMRRL
ncbi:MAG: SLC13 family permease [Planctomycetota bacterium]|nr:SLC13 family permease [Planctomycetota bacterium]